MEIPKISSLIKKRKIKSIIDVGCGHAGYLKRLSSHYPVPTEEELNKIANSVQLNVKSFKPLVKEGGWYRITMTKK